MRGPVSSGALLQDVSSYLNQLRQVVTALERDGHDARSLAADLDRLSTRIGFLVDRTQEYALRRSLPDQTHGDAASRPAASR
jgi:hypothetical protein